MKRYSFPIDDRQVRVLFRPIRNKLDSIRLLMESIKIMLINSPPHESQVCGELALVSSRMNRLFFFTQNKYFSVSFPLKVTIENESTIGFSSTQIPVIDSKVTSDVISIISNQYFTEANVYDFFGEIADLEEYESGLWQFLLHLLLSEDGYIRYDFDPENEKGEYHPAHHYDFFYSRQTTFKIGLRSRITEDLMIDFIRSDTKCHFLE